MLKDTQDLSNLRTIKLEVGVDCQASGTFTCSYVHPISVRISSFLCREITYPHERCERLYWRHSHRGVHEPLLLVRPVVIRARSRILFHYSLKDNLLETQTLKHSNTNTQIPTGTFQRLAKRTVHFPLLSVLESRCAL